MMIGGGEGTFHDMVDDKLCDIVEVRICDGLTSAGVGVADIPLKEPRIVVVLVIPSYRDY